jgi:hypothetical protein
LAASDGPKQDDLRVTLALIITPDDHDQASFIKIKAIMKHPLFARPGALCVAKLIAAKSAISEQLG